ncbi:methionine ABC transporter ATP-binding protein [Kytococcus sedentarius]|uniref:methionine ABC transporter ATP-binding protein n=1 Tax=Kytococcus sedentarius TaxID=1276 RepID=UPI0035BC4B79
MITLESISKTFPGRHGGGEVQALTEVSLQIDRGQVHGIVGPSGSGKSTLVRCINLLERPTSGRVVVDGRELTALSTGEVRRARREIGMIFQHFNLLDSRTAAENVALPLELAGVGRRERAQRATELLERVGLADRAGAHPRQLSGGQKQRVAIARALVTRPTVLLCDEATSALDPETTASVLDLLRELTADLGLTTVLITHEMDVVTRVADAVTLLSAGRVVESGTLAQVATTRGSALAAQLVPRPVRGLDPADLPAGSRIVTVDLATQDETRVIAELTAAGHQVQVAAARVENLHGARVGTLDLIVRDAAPSSDLPAGWTAPTALPHTTRQELSA